MNKMQKENFYQVYFLDSDSDSYFSDDEKLQTKFESLEQLFNNLYDKNNHLYFNSNKLKEDATSKLINNIEYETGIIRITIRNYCLMCEYEHPIKYLYNKDNILYCSSCLDFISRDLPFIECDLCEEYEHSDDLLIKKYNDICICHNCISLYSNKNIIMKDNNECPICYDETKVIKLPLCEHYLCINCFKKIHYGKSLSETKYNLRLKLSKPKFPYEFKKSREYQNWIDDNEDIYYSNNKKSWTKICKKRPEWMNTIEFIEYEKKEKIYRKLEEENNDILHGLGDESYNTSNCPLCRK
jgi:hypothetical protein